MAIIEVGLGEYGDIESSVKIGPHKAELATLVEKYCKSTYATEIESFFIIFRVDGEIWNLNFEGVKYLRRSKKKKEINCDVGIKKESWYGKEPMEIRKLLVDLVEDALTKMIEHLRKQKVNVDAELLFHDFNKAKKIFLSRTTSRIVEQWIKRAKECREDIERINKELEEEIQKLKNKT